MKTYKLDDEFKEFIDHKKYTCRLRPASIKTYEYVWELFRKQMPEVVAVDDLSPEVITKFFSRLQTRERLVGKAMERTGIKDSTADTYGRRLRSFFEWLVIKGLLDKNPVELKDLPKPVYDDLRALDRQQIEKLIVAVMQNSKNTFIQQRDVAMINVFVFCGLRRGEMLGLKVTDIDFDKALLRVDGETSKSKKSRHVPLHRAALQSLDSYMQARKQNKVQCEYLWVSETQDRPFTEHGLKHWVNRLREWSGVRFHVHQFRHSFACALGKNRVNVVMIQKLLGHYDLRMTQKYLRSMGADDMRDLVQELSLASF